MDEEILRKQLNTVNTSLFFLLVVIASVLFSYFATLRQRDAICLTMEGETEEAARVGDVYEMRKGASALILGALGYFLCFAVTLMEQSDNDISKRSAWANLWASMLVLAAAIIRFRDLNQTRMEDLDQESGTLADTQIES